MSGGGGGGSGLTAQQLAQLAALRIYLQQTFGGL
jgi:hypothetical protein